MLARAALNQLGYIDSLVREFTSGGRTVSVGHSQTPLVARNACVAVLPAPDQDWARVARDVGEETAAPAVLFLAAGAVAWWCPDATAPEGARRVDQVVGPSLERWRHQLDPRAVQRARTPGRPLGAFQLSLFGRSLALPPVDRSLLGRHEAKQAQHLAEFLEGVMAAIHEAAPPKTPEELHEAITVAFWIVASRVLRDAGVPTFERIDYSDPRDVLERVRDHYGAAIPLHSRHPQWHPALAKACALARDYWKVSATSVSPEVLGRLDETLHMNAATRKALGAHSTPTFLIDYIVSGLSEKALSVPAVSRMIVEPACGHAGFLVAGLRLLASDVPSNVDRHSFLRSRVRGADLDAMSCEVARLALTLADMPNPDGWQISGGEDLFLDRRLEELIGDATVILANPPFEDFTPKERAKLTEAGCPPVCAGRAAEVLRRCVAVAQPGCLLGFVLPPGLIDSTREEGLRRDILLRADILEVTELPDAVFRKAGTKSFSLLAQIRGPSETPTATWRFKRVKRTDLAGFRLGGATSSDEEVYRSDVEADPLCSFRVPELHTILSLHERTKLSSFAQDLGQGSSLNTDAPEGAPVKCVVKHLVLGEAARGKSLIGKPDFGYTDQRGGGKPRWRLGRATGRPRVVLNRARRSRYGWWLQAFIDPDGEQVIHDGFVVEPREPSDTLILWAVLNSPFANVYARDCTENSLTNRPLEEMPIPNLDAEGRSALVAGARRCFDAGPRLSEAMLQLDALVHALYGLRAVDEWEILDSLAGMERPGVGPYPTFEGFNRRLPLYLQVDVVPYLPPVHVPASLKSCFSPQPGIYDELAALDDVEPSDQSRRREVWLRSWLSQLQKLEVEREAPLPGLSEEDLAEIARLRGANADPRS